MLKTKTYLVTIEDRLGNRSNVRAEGVGAFNAIKQINRQAYDVIAVRRLAPKGQNLD